MSRETEKSITSDEVIERVFEAFCKEATWHVFCSETPIIGLETGGGNKGAEGMTFKSLADLEKAITFYNRMAISPSDGGVSYVISLGVSAGKYSRSIAVMKAGKEALRFGHSEVVDRFKKILGRNNVSEVSIVASTCDKGISFFQKIGDACVQDYIELCSREYRQQPGWRPAMVEAVVKQLKKNLGI